MVDQILTLYGRQKTALEAAREPKVIEDRHYHRDLAVDLYQDPAGVWFVKINGGSPMLATDVEVHLWKQLKAIKRRGVIVEWGPEAK